MNIELPKKLAEWKKQSPVCVVTPAELQFIVDLRKAVAQGVGYGWIQQIAEWEWQETLEKQGLPGSWGPEYFAERDKTFAKKMAHALKHVRAAIRLIRKKHPEDACQHLGLADKSLSNE